LKNRQIYWVNTSCKKDLEDFPKAVKDQVIFALDIAREGGKHSSAKPLKGFNGASILEVVQRGKNATFRAVYTVEFEEAIFVLHCFQKKSKTGIKTPKEEIDLIKNRYKQAVAIYKLEFGRKKAK